MTHGGDLPDKEGKEPTGWSIPVERLAKTAPAATKTVRFSEKSNPNMDQNRNQTNRSKGTTDASSITIDPNKTAATNRPLLSLARNWSTGTAKNLYCNPGNSKDYTKGGALEQNYLKLLSTAGNTTKNTAEQAPNKSNVAPIPNTSNVAPILLTNVQYIQGIPMKSRPLLALLDSGSSGTLINKRALPFGTLPIRSKHQVLTTTANGSFDTTEYIIMKNIKLQEFGNYTIDKQEARLFHSPNCRYDLILGRDFLHLAQINLLFKEGAVQWMDRTIPMKDTSLYHETDYTMLMEELEDAELFADDLSFANPYKSKVILDRAYQETDPSTVAQQQSHMSKAEQQQFQAILSKYPNVFNGELGKYPHKKISLRLKPGSKPIHKKPYPVAYKREDLFKRELQNLCNDGVLKRCTGPAEWAFPTFIGVPKKDNRVRWVSDFRELNELLERRPYPIPRIQDIMNKRGKYTHFTKIDLSMQYYCFELDDASKKLCTIVTPYGCYEYQRLPMGVKVSPDVAQQLMEDILQDTDCTVYIDDIGIWTNGSFDVHMKTIDKILDRLNQNGLKCNPLKCDWAVQETDFLGYWMTPTAVKPWRKKIEAILHMDRPRTVTQVKSFLGAVGYYRDMWPRRSHVLAPLFDITGTPKTPQPAAIKGKQRKAPSAFTWGPAQDKAFQEMKAMVAADALNTYPDLNKPFELYTDASDLQLGAAILQDGKPIAYWSKKLSDAQKNYTTMEKELLAIVLCCKEYRKMLLGGVINVYTDHKNLTFRTLSVQRVLRWRLFLEEFGVNLTYVEGKKNVLADAFSRLPRMDPPTVGKKEAIGNGTLIDFLKLEVPKQDE